MTLTTDLRQLPLNVLSIAPDNMRKMDPPEGDKAAMLASVRTYGVLAPLLASPSENGGFLVKDGGMRLRALQQLHDEGAIEAGASVPCAVLEDGEDIDGEVSLAMNAARVPVHPADQVVAFAELHKAGRTPEEIAVRFGCSERVVHQRLRLGNVHPDLMHAYREEAISLETLMAFTLTEDQGQQLAAFEKLSKQPYRIGSHQVKSMLSDEKLRGDTSLARLVGVEAYEKAGGAVTRDLFSEHEDSGTFLDDVQLAHRLANEKLEGIAAELGKKWKWAEAHLNWGYGQEGQFTRMHADPGDPTPEETAELEQNEKRRDELNTKAETDELTEEQYAELERLDVRESEIEDAVNARAAWTDDQLKRGGAVVTMDYNGSVKIVEGLVRREDRTAEDKGKSAGTGSTFEDLRKKALKDAGIGQSVADDLRLVRQAVVKAHVAGNFNAAFDLALFTMVRGAMMTGSLYSEACLDLKAVAVPDQPMGRQLSGEQSPGTVLLDALREQLKLNADWLLEKDRAKSFELMCALPVKTKQALFAACVAHTIKGQLTFEHGTKPELESVIARLKIKWAKLVRPRADMFWSRVPKDMIMRISRATLGDEWTQQRMKLKKGELADVMEAAFSDKPPSDLLAGASKDQKAAAKAWTIPGFAPDETA